MYQRLEDLFESVRTSNSYVSAFDASVFDGKYVTGGVSAELLSRIDEERRDETRQSTGGAVLKFSRKPVHQ